MNFFEKLPFVSYLVLMFILSGKILLLQRRKIRTGIENGQKNTGKHWILPFFLLIILLWIFELSRAAIGFSLNLLPGFISDPLFVSNYLKGFGAVYIAIGLFGFALTLRHFGDSLRFGLDRENKGKLVTSGMFALSRNPFFLSLEFYFLGIALVLPSLFFIFFTLSAFAGIHFYILKEERFLAENYGTEYRDYCENTRRYI